MANKKVFENPEYARLPATPTGASALGLDYYYTGKLCKRGHRGIRYASSGNCVLCMAESQGRTKEGMRLDRSEANFVKAVASIDAGNSTYIPESPCPRGHFLRFAGSNNCVECDKEQQAERKVRGYSRWRRLEKVYGITKIEFENLLFKQNGKCAVCEKQLHEPGVLNYSKIHVDHCHTENKIRGLLCGPCNQAIGLLKEDLVIVEKVWTYLKNSK